MQNALNVGVIELAKAHALVAISASTKIKVCFSRP